MAVTSDLTLKSFSPLFVGVEVPEVSFPLMADEPLDFQSPIRRGRGCWTFSPAPQGSSVTSFSPLFVGVEVAGTELFGDHATLDRSFSPLFVGVEVAGGTRLFRAASRRVLSVPYSSGSRLLGQSGRYALAFSNTFSPLFVGVEVAGR